MEICSYKGVHFLITIKYLPISFLASMRMIWAGSISSSFSYKIKKLTSSTFNFFPFWASQLICNATRRSNLPFDKKLHLLACKFLSLCRTFLPGDNPRDLWLHENTQCRHCRTRETGNYHRVFHRKAKPVSLKRRIRKSIQRTATIINIDLNTS